MERSCRIAEQLIRTGNVPRRRQPPIGIHLNCGQQTVWYPLPAILLQVYVLEPRPNSIRPKCIIHRAIVLVSFIVAVYMSSCDIFWVGCGAADSWNALPRPGRHHRITYRMGNHYL